MINVPKAISKVTIDWTEWEHTLEKTEDMRPIFTDMYVYLLDVISKDTDTDISLGLHPSSMMRSLFVN